MKTALLIILTIIFSACSSKTDLDNIVDADMKATLRDFINAPNEFPVYLYAVDYSLPYPENKILLDSTINKQMSFDIPYLVANKKRYDIHKIWGLREAKSKSITTELKIEFTK
jgi:hypothetical protein